MARVENGWLIFEDGRSAVVLAGVCKVSRLPEPVPPNPGAAKTAVLCWPGGWVEVTDDYDDVLKNVVSNWRVKE